MIVGLGNPGGQYSGTRHNIGEMVVERLGEKLRVSFFHEYQSYQAVGSIGSQSVQLVRPQTWMNQSGTVLDDFVKRLGISPSDLIVVYDDMDLNFGVLRIKTRGGAGGHNGIRSILSHLATDQFCRLKIGIGHPPPGTDTADYVLSPFSTIEASELNNVIGHAVEAIEAIALHGAALAMNQFNTQPKQDI